jgi:hypothetical protein
LVDGRQLSDTQPIRGSERDDPEQDGGLVGIVYELKQRLADVEAMLDLQVIGGKSYTLNPEP